MFDTEKLISISVVFSGFYLILNKVMKNDIEFSKLQHEIKFLEETNKLQEQRISSLEDFID